MKRLLWFVFATAVLASSVGLALGAEYTFTTLDYPGATHTQARTINDSNEVIGTWQKEIPAPPNVALSPPLGFIWDSGAFTLFQFPGAADTFPTGINNQGFIVGTMDKDNQLKSFLYQVKPNARQKRARMNEINWSAYNLSADSAWVIGINNHGEVSGEFSMPLPMVPGQSNHRQVGFVMDGDSLSPIDPPANCFAASSATGVNNKGQIAGWYFCSEPFGWHGFLSHDMGDTFTIFDYPGTLGTTIANGINAKGQVVGNYNDSLGTHGFVYDNGQFKAIDVPGARQTVANGINKQGVVVGYYALRW